MAAGIELFQGHYVEHLPRDDAARRGPPPTG
jgi:hypothetical protein